MGEGILECWSVGGMEEWMDAAVPGEFRIPSVLNIGVLDLKLVLCK